MNTQHAAQVLRNAAPMFGHLPVPSTACCGERAQTIDFVDMLDSDPEWLAKRVAKGVKSDCNGLPMKSWMVGATAIIIDLR